MKKTGIFSWYGYFSDFARRVEHIKAAGFDGLMLWWEDDIGDWPYHRRQMVQMTRAAGLEIFNIHIAGIDDNFLWSDDHSLREKHLFQIAATIEEIADEGLSNLVIHLCESQDIPAPGASLLESIEYLLPIAERNHATLSLENTWRSDYLEVVWQEFNSPLLGFCFDSSHAQLRQHFALIKDHYEKLTALHLADNDGMEDRHWLPFDGVIDFENLVIPYLAKTDVPYTMELMGSKDRYDDDMDYLREAKKRVDQLLALEKNV